MQGGQIWGFDAGTRDWRTDIDFDGFDWGSASNPFEYRGVTYSTLLGLSNASGLEANGVRVWKESCFETFDVPGPAPTPVPPQVMTLQAGCPAVDAGVGLNGFNDGFSGNAPDLGAHEYGQPPPTYGPRAATQPPLAPGLLVATVVSSTRVDLRWTDRSNSENGFRIERAAAAQPFVLLATVGPNVIAYSDLSVAAGGQYTYRVAAYNEAGLSAYSNTTSVTTSSGSTPYGGTPAALPGTVQIENFDDGGSGVAYLDTTSGNSGGRYRATDVDIDSTTDTGAATTSAGTLPGQRLKALGDRRERGHVRAGSPRRERRQWRQVPRRDRWRRQHGRDRDAEHGRVAEMADGDEGRTVIERRGARYSPRVRRRDDGERRRRQLQLAAT